MTMDDTILSNNNEYNIHEKVKRASESEATEIVKVAEDHF